MKNKLLLSTSIILATLMPASATAIDLDPNLPEYSKASGVSGDLISVGSDTLANLMTLWAEEFKKLYPNVNVQIQAAALQPRRRR